MTDSFTETKIKRHANGSIDTAYYMALGRKARSDEAYHLAHCTRAVVQRRFRSLRDMVEAATAASKPA